jgi:hypothetical protein
MCPIGYAAEDSDGGERHVAWRMLECPDVQVEVTGCYLVRLIDEFRRGQVDLVQGRSEERWGEVLAPAPRRWHRDSSSFGAPEVRWVYRNTILP